MKKIFSILLVITVLLSSLHFTVATHFCGGKISAIKAGLEGTIASCGMETVNSNCTNQSDISSASCCKNSSSVWSVDNYKIPSNLILKKLDLKLLQVFSIPVLHIFQVPTLNNISFASGGFHQPLLSLPGRLAFICVFRK